ncbi:protein RER1A-like [Cynara cardunculus var. scolymus]|uniref:protein RER1A-like n=1 Tax=Cynara cardunculus var. scolymus TaxID=59895 RepID=UPI000D62F289|nr:protein RER1A-like [Cynara cardunculus var. scolymus]
MNVGGDNDLKSSGISEWTNTLSRRYQYILDKSTPLVFHRWIGFTVVFFIYALRVYFVQGYYIITYALGIYILQLFLAFLSPQVDPELEEISDGPSLPTHGSEEFRPFVRRLPEFKFWYSITKAFCIAFVLTFFGMFDVPVFWPILLFYWMVLFIATMKRQIMHMIKYRYIPFSFGKQRYTGKKAAVDGTSSSRP